MELYNKRARNLCIRILKKGLVYLIKFRYTLIEGALSINRALKKLYYKHAKELDEQQAGKHMEAVFSGGYSLEEMELFMQLRGGKNFMQTEEIDNAEYTGYLVLDNDNIIVRVERSKVTKETYCYVYADSNSDDYTAKFKID